jgi:hypothetical protein
MSLETALGMLKVGNTGNDILSILDVIAADIASEQDVNEIAEILFWMWYLVARGLTSVNLRAIIHLTAVFYGGRCVYKNRILP